MIIIIVCLTDRFIGEESTSDDTQLELSDDPTWVIDPIDGTTNFVHRFVTNLIVIAYLQCNAVFLHNRSQNTVQTARSCR